MRWIGREALNPLVRPGAVALLALLAFAIGRSVAEVMSGPGTIAGVLAAFFVSAVGIAWTYSRYTLRPTRTVVLTAAVVLGGIEIAGALLALITAAAVGGLTGSWVNLVLLFVLFGPVAFFLSSIFAIWQPKLAGAAILFAGIASAFLAIWLMKPSPSTWSPGGTSIAVYTFKWSLTLILPVSLPMVLLGLWLIMSSPIDGNASVTSQKRFPITNEPAGGGPVQRSASLDNPYEPREPL